MISKKAQSEIITTVLIILLVLAAIIIVWQVVNSTLNKGAAQIQSQSSCIGLTMSVVSAHSATKIVTVRRDPGGPTTNAQSVVFVNGAQATPLGAAAGLAQLSTEPITLTSGLNTGDMVQVGAKLPDGTACPLGAEFNATA
jgi:flagellin-like protein